MVKATAQPYKLLTYTVYNIQQQPATQNSNNNLQITLYDTCSVRFLAYSTGTWPYTILVDNTT